MKISYSIQCLVCIIIVFLYSCNKETAFDCIKSTGKIQEKNIETDEFHSISLNDDIDLVISQGNENRVMLKTGRNLMPKIRFEIKDQVLHISNKNTCNWVRKFENPQVHISVQDLSTLYHNGYGNIQSEGKLVFEDFNIQNYNGNGDISLDLEVEKLEVFSKSYALITLKGKAKNLNLSYYYNHGKFMGQYLTTENLTVTHLGLNTLEVFPVQSMDLFIGHSGNVVYYNEPEILQSQVISNGQLIKKF